MPRMTTANAIVTSLIDRGIDTIFGLPGVQMDGFFNALHDQQDRIRVIHPRHEQGAAYMALGAAMATGKPSAYAVVPGPGFLNTASALATAYGCNAPVLCMLGQVPSNFIGKGIGQLHEIPDQLSIMRQLTKWAARIDYPDEAPRMVTQAFRQMLSGRQRPVALECAMDVLKAEADIRLSPVSEKPSKPALDSDAINDAARLLAAARKPMIISGAGANNASAALARLAELLQAPVMTTRMGRGSLSSRHPLAVTMIAGEELWATTDCVVGVGSRMQYQQRAWGIDESMSFIRIDVDIEEHDRQFSPDVAITADAGDAMTALAEALEKIIDKRPSRTDEMDQVRARAAERTAHLEPQLSYIKVMREELPDEGIFVDELTQTGYVARFALPVYGPRTYLSTGYQGTLGWGFATALGVKIARPEVPVLSINGDGGFMFTAQEMATAVQQNVNLVAVVFNDGAFGNVQRMQKDLYGNRVIATHLHNPDFVKYAESFGAKGLRADSPETLRSALREGFKSDGPVLIDTRVGEMPDPWELIYPHKIRG